MGAGVAFLQVIVTFTLAVLPVDERWARAPSLTMTLGAGGGVWPDAGDGITPSVRPVTASAIAPLLRVRIMAGYLPAAAGRYSHSMVPGGFDVTSKATRFTPGTSLISLLEIRSSTS